LGEDHGTRPVDHGLYASPSSLLPSNRASEHTAANRGVRLLLPRNCESFSLTQTSRIDEPNSTKEDEGGLEICAACLVVFCAKHAYIHYNKSSHQFSICVRSVHYESNPSTPVAERPNIDPDAISLADSRTEVASEAETDETAVDEPGDAGDVQCALRCWQCGVDGEGLIIYVPPEADGAHAVTSQFPSMPFNFN